MENKEGAPFLEKYYLSRSEGSSDPLRFLKETREAFSSFILLYEIGNRKENPFFKGVVEKYNVHVKVLEALIKKKSL